MSKHDTSLSTSDDFVDDTTFGGNSDELGEARKVAENETVRVRLWRFINADTIIMIACGITITAYALLRDMEKREFEEWFTAYSLVLGQAVLKGQTTKHDALRNFATTISSFADSSNSTWPVFEVPNFETQAKHLKKLAGLDQIVFAPKIEHDDQEQWMSFISRHEQEDIYMEFTRHDYIENETTNDFYFPPAEWYKSPLAPKWEATSPFIHNEDVVQALKNETLLVASQTRDSSSDSLYGWTQMISPILVTNEPDSDGGDDGDDDEKLGMLHSQDGNLVGIVSGGFAWQKELEGILPKDATNGILAVIISSCNATYSYEVNGPRAVFKSAGDLHDPVYDQYGMDFDLAVYNNPSEPQIHGHCLYTMHAYPTRSFEVAHRTWFPEIVALALTLSFVLIAATFFIYDILVDSRNEKLVEKFARSNAIVNSLFPRAYRDRLMEDGDDNQGEPQTTRTNSSSAINYRSLKGIMSMGDAKLANKDHNGLGASGRSKSKPLADIFPDVSILFADIAGFTAWSSVREPSQVFTLLETLYGNFDAVAKRRCIFKVETVGDCYVAACGLPRPRRDHAVAMIRFANDILSKMKTLTRRLEVTLGPDTGDLSLRIGINSGTATAGILRGDKARFQLFGDVVNTASRVESLGEPGRIQISKSTADLVISAGYDHWLVKRSDMIAAKGKGLIQTYWVATHMIRFRSSAGRSLAPYMPPTEEQDASSEHSEVGAGGLITRVPSTVKESNHREHPRDHINDNEHRRNRQIDWSVEVLLQLIKQIVAHRQNNKENQPPSSQEQNTMNNDQRETTSLSSTAVQPLDEVKEIISLPEFNPILATKTTKVEPQHVKIPDPVLHQLRGLVTAIHGRYNSNPFHNFEHANHVTMSVCKLLSRIVSPLDDLPDTDKIASTTESQPPAAEHAASVAAVAAMHDHTYDITSDPLTQFACVFSALIHDVDHPGVSNAQLANESDPLAHTYHNRSIAEQHSLDLSWDLFMDSSFDALRATICSSEAELSRFRQLIVNAVMATDIVDKELKALRNDRWDKAFRNEDPNNGDDHSATGEEEPANIARNRKATIVIEHLIQASDVAHTMQHWHVYRSWNERLFREVYKAYKEGRCANDPSDGWYQGEIGFFDFYIIPLAKKLKDCGVFGVSSDEYLDYALNNREEWVARGHEVVAKISEAAKREFG